jgi:hypothetical protein
LGCSRWQRSGAADTGAAHHARSPTAQNDPLYHKKTTAAGEAPTGLPPPAGGACPRRARAASHGDGPAAQRQLSAALLAAVKSEPDRGTTGSRQCASRRLRDEIERGKQRASYLRAATGGARGGGRALPGRSRPGSSPRQRCQLHSLVRVLLLILEGNML